MPSGNGMAVARPDSVRSMEVLTPDVLAFLAELEAMFGSRRLELLKRRAERSGEISRGGGLDFLDETREIRMDDSWQVAKAPPPLLDRRVEITGPTDAKTVINAMNSGASAFMADFEDANTPTWENLLQGQTNLIETVKRRIEHTGPDGKEYRLTANPALLLVRPRGWHLEEKHIRVEDAPVSASLFDFGVFMFHNAKALVESECGPYFYLPKLESHLEARLWNDVFVAAQGLLGLPRGTIRATVLIETIPAAFEMEEILFELREHSAGLNAGRWDYIFSIIKNFRERADFLLPDRNSVTMTAPCMRAYTELLVATCHRRGAFAIGGMAAFVPSRRDPTVNDVALAKVRQDKQREATDGFDGTWVAHPDLVAVAKEAFDRVLGDRPNQLDRRRPEVQVTAAELLDVKATPGTITEAGLRNNVAVGLHYLESWLSGRGAVAIFNLMEDVATAEIARSQVWQWIRHGARLDTGQLVTAELVRQMEDEELDRIREELGDHVFDARRFKDARDLFERVALSSDGFVEFLTLPAYELID